MQPRAILAVSLVSITIVMVMLAPSTSIIMVDAKPDNTKFCQEFSNDDGTTGDRCIYKSMGECKQQNEKIEQQDHIRCHKDGK